jgi:hypothetical protein
VSQDSSPEVTIDPRAIPDDATLVLAAERVTMQRERPASIVVRLLLVRGPAPACVGEFLKRPTPLERFTLRAREVVAYAQEEAAALHHANVEAEHILLALVLARGEVAARILSEEGADPKKVRNELSGLHGPEKPRGYPGEGWSALSWRCSAGIRSAAQTPLAWAVWASRGRREPGAGQVPRMVAEVAITFPDQSSGCTAT